MGAQQGQITHFFPQESEAGQIFIGDKFSFFRERANGRAIAAGLIRWPPALRPPPVQVRRGDGKNYWGVRALLSSVCPSLWRHTRVKRDDGRRTRTAVNISRYLSGMRTLQRFHSSSGLVTSETYSFKKSSTPSDFVRFDMKGKAVYLSDHKTTTPPPLPHPPTKAHKSTFYSIPLTSSRTVKSSKLDIM